MAWGPKRPAPTKKALSKGVNQAASKSLTTKGVNQAARSSIPGAPSRGVNQASRQAVRKPAARSAARSAAKPPAARKPTKPATRAPAAPARSGGARAPSAGGVATGGGVAPSTTPAARDIETQARNTYGYMSWALDDGELGPLLRQAATEGWDENRLKGAVFKTNWFKTHGTAKVAASIKEQADAYLVPMDDGSRKNFAMKIITGELQGAEMNTWLREQSKSMFPHLAGAIDRGITVKDYASPYRAIAAQTLELPPEAINLNEPRWRRALDGQVDPKTNERAPMSLADWERTLKTSSEYGWDLTKGARTEASAFAAKLAETFGAR